MLILTRNVLSRRPGTKLVQVRCKTVSIPCSAWVNPARSTLRSFVEPPAPHVTVVAIGRNELNRPILPSKFSKPYISAFRIFAQSNKDEPKKNRKCRQGCFIQIRNIRRGSQKSRLIYVLDQSLEGRTRKCRKDEVNSMPRFCLRASSPSRNKVVCGARGPKVRRLEHSKAKHCEPICRGSFPLWPPT